MNELVGIVACGGKSSRMGTDKSRICYQNKEQRYVLYEMLNEVCDKVFISCNSTQATSILPAYNFIVDAPEYSEKGPMAALLSAFKKLPQVSVMLIGCDYPLLKLEDLEKMKMAREENINALCYSNAITNMNEPLIALYENNCVPLLMQNNVENKLSLRQFLNEVKVLSLFPDSDERINSVDTPEQVAECQRYFKIKEV